MEPILEFFEAYWGYTLFGGLTIGTLVTFAVLMVKSLLKDGKLRTIINNTIGEAKHALTIAKEEKERAEKTAAELLKERAYTQKLIAVTFEAISYLVVASKLPISEKLELQKKFEVLLKPEEEAEVVEEEVVEEDVVTKVVTKTKTLLDKYTEE